MNDEQSTKDRILKAAAEIFAEQGFERTSMRMIAEKSQVTKPAVYYYFPDKKTLFEELIKTALQYSRENIEKVEASSKGTIEKLYDIVMTRFSEILHQPEIARFVYNVMCGNIPCEIKLNFHNELKSHLDFLNRIIVEGQNSGVLRKDIDVQSFMYCFEGGINIYIMRYFKMGINELTEDKAKLLIKTLVEGIINPEYARSHQ